MMDYEIFKAVVKENFLHYLPEEYRDAEIRIYPAKKVNCTLDGLTVLPKGNAQVFPTVYINEMYEHYQSCDDLEAVLQGVAQQYAQTAERVKGRHPGEILDVKMEHFKDNIIMCLVNTEQNRELLADVPNRAFHDLSVIYRWVVENTPDAIGSVIVSNEIAGVAGMTEEELFRCAVKNTRRINPVSIELMKDIVGVIPEGIPMPSEMREELEKMKQIAENTWIVSNEKKINGAVSMLYEENLHQLAEKLGEDLLILPSSIHEVIAVPAGMAEGKLANMLEAVQKINREEVRLEERLSNSVYHYDRTARKITLAVESPEKRLDGKQAEMPPVQEDKWQR